MKDGMNGSDENRPGLLRLSFVLLSVLLLGGCATTQGIVAERPPPLSDHFNGTYFVNPGSPSHTGDAPKRGVLGYLWQWMAGNVYPGWPKFKEYPPGQPPAARVPKGTLRITSIGHASFLIQMDGLNILIDPVWAKRSSPVHLGRSQAPQPARPPFGRPACH